MNRVLDKKRIFLWLTILLVTGFILLSGELLCRFSVSENQLNDAGKERIMNPWDHNIFTQYCRPWIYLTAPNSRYVSKTENFEVSYRINNLGFRGEDIVTKKTDAKRLLVLGDSFIEGWGCEYPDSIPQIIQKKIKDDNWEVINCGIQGASPVYFACNMPRYLDLNPDTVLIFLYDNDLYEDRYREKQYFTLPVLDQPLVIMDNSLKSVPSRSKLLLWVNRIIKKYFLSDLEQLIRKNRNSYTQDAEQIQLNDISSYLVAPSMFEAVWGMSEKYLNSIVHQFGEKGIKVAVVNFSVENIEPSQEEVYKNHAILFDHAVSKWAKVNSVEHLSLSIPIFNALCQNGWEDFIIPDDGHMTVKGNQFVVESLLPWLEAYLNE